MHVAGVLWGQGDKGHRLDPLPKIVCFILDNKYQVQKL